jgi:hypothetical protein
VENVQNLTAQQCSSLKDHECPRDCGTSWELQLLLLLSIGREDWTTYPYPENDQNSKIKIWFLLKSVSFSWLCKIRPLLIRHLYCLRLFAYVTKILP